MPTGIHKLNLSNSLRKVRLKRGLSAKDVAEKVQVSASHLSEVESGKRNPSAELLARLLTLYGISEEEFREVKNSTLIVSDPPEFGKVLAHLVEHGRLPWLLDTLQEAAANASAGDRSAASLVAYMVPIIRRRVDELTKAAEPHAPDQPDT
jgi:transcriptional regulator with XRE-family HTH domain